MPRTRLVRRFTAWLGILAIAVGQAAAAVQACPIDRAGNAAAFDPPAFAAEATVAVGIDGGCAGHRDGGASPAPLANACEVHCMQGAQPDAPAAMPAPAPAPMLVVAMPCEVLPLSAAQRPLDAKSAAPPPQLLFSRYLI
jgi:hypothetical protein